MVNDLRLPKVLVLGASGMLGSMVYNYLSHSGYELKATVRNKEQAFNKNNFFIFDAAKDEIGDILKKFRPDYLINCIGIINKYCQEGDIDGITRAIEVNSIFPYRLADAAAPLNTYIIQIATDCVFSGQQGNYTERSIHDPIDIYGRTKSLGEAHLKNILHIRCSIIGPEIGNKISLLEWFLAKKTGETVSGYAHHKWNGVTTLQFAQLCEQIINKGKDDLVNLINHSGVYHYTPNQAVSKYDLLEIFNEVFNKGIKIDKVYQPGPPIDRTLSTEFSVFSADKISTLQAVQELADYMNK